MTCAASRKSLESGDSFFGGLAVLTAGQQRRRDHGDGRGFPDVIADFHAGQHPPVSDVSHDDVTIDRH